MITAGCDVGSLTTKVVIMKDGAVIAHQIVETGFKPDLAVESALQGALSQAGLSRGELGYCVSTGDGGKNVSFAGKYVSQLPCLSKGSYFFVPSVRTVVDVGGNATRAISVGKEGRVLGYRLNDKCAAGGGRFFDVLAEALEVKLDDLGPLSQQSKSPLEIASQCTVFAESEVISLINDGKDVVDIIAGVNRSIASRIASLVRNVGIKEDVVMTGGVARNIGVVKSLEGWLGVGIKMVPTDPRIVGAVGAALLAGKELGEG